ncbi:MAG TPA: zinc-dependent metalloprotease [Intrasporangiaceae bacterium]|nr:zinc-dependent metalloprotease [Intrasporangiaceae bacterium]
MTDALSTDPTGTAAPSYVDWGFAKTAGRRLVQAGPSVSPAEAREAVEQIRLLAAEAVEPVAATSRMHAPGAAPAPVVIDRPTWISVNADSMAALMDPVFAAVMAAKEHPPSATAAAIGGKVTGAEAGALLAFLSGKVLGQYDLAPAGTPQLLLVAPNMVQIGRDLQVDETDFRRWVCMHEETHRVQFTAVPWLREHLIDSARSLAKDLVPDPESLQDRVGQILSRLPEAFSGEGGGLADLVTTPQVRERVAELTAVMSLLEGHADVVMDEVGPQVIPTVAEIRRKFTARRKGTSALDKLLRRLLGLDAKMRQYRDGAVFVRAVVDQVGWDGLNAVWTSPQTLPQAREIADPAAWVARVYG